MNISSYNITDVSYHYIGLRVLDGIPADSGRGHQSNTISRSVLKFVNDKALRLMLPEPKGAFETVGEKVCRELVHFQLAHSSRAGYELTEAGRKALNLLASRKYVELRRLMVAAHLRTYDNLRAVVQSHLEVGFVWMPIVTHKLLGDNDQLLGLLEPTFGHDATAEIGAISNGHMRESPKKVESLLHGRIIRRIAPNQKIAVPIFATIRSRLVSLRLLNIRRSKYKGCSELEFEKSYSPCVQGSPARPWHMPLDVPLANGANFRIYLSEPDLKDVSQQAILLEAIDKGFSEMSPIGGYYDIPDLRDWVCEYLLLPESAFDEGLNHLLDVQPPILSAGLRYQGISSQRKPMVRNRGDVQIYNLVRRI